jgi:hypothetical protein
MRVLHERHGTNSVLAREVDVVASTLSRARGLMFRRSIPDDYALVFEFDAPASRDVHMVFVPFAIDAVWLVDDEVTHVKRLRPWLGLGKGRADTLLELPAGAAADVAVGDVVRVGK